jgi:hypothetical protein
MGRRRQIGYGTSTSSQVRAVPVWNQPVDRRKLAQALLALVLAEAERDKRSASVEEVKDA